jgi:hypothetical protein
MSKTYILLIFSLTFFTWGSTQDVSNQLSIMVKIGLLKLCFVAQAQPKHRHRSLITGKQEKHVKHGR